MNSALERYDWCESGYLLRQSCEREMILPTPIFSSCPTFRFSRFGGKKELLNSLRWLRLIIHSSSGSYFHRSKLSMVKETTRNVGNVFPVDVDVVQSAPETPAPTAILREFSLNTSTHGIPGIARSQSISNRVYWIISLLAFTGIMIYFIVEAIRAYLEYPIQTVMTSEEVMNPTFPAVSFCNYSPLRYDRFIGPFLTFTNERRLTNTNDTTTFSIEQAGYIRDFFQYVLNRNQSLTEYFYPLDGMLLSYKYNNRNCSFQDFVRFHFPSLRRLPHIQQTSGLH